MNEKFFKIMDMRREVLFDQGATQLGGKVSDPQKEIKRLSKAIIDVCELRRKMRLRRGV